MQYIDAVEKYALASSIGNIWILVIWVFVVITKMLL